MMDLEWIIASPREGYYTIFLNRGGVKYPLATIFFGPALGAADLEKLLRSAPGLQDHINELNAELLEARKEHLTLIRQLYAIIDDLHTWVWNTDEGQELMAAIRAALSASGDDDGQM